MVLMSEVPNVPPSQEANWYGDPDGKDGQRWWNGKNWTADSRPAPVSVRGQEEPTRGHRESSGSEQPARDARLLPSTPPQKRRIGSIGVGMIVLGVLVVFVFVSCSMVRSNSGSNTDDSYNGCSKLLPTDEFHDCIYREGRYSGINDVPSP